MKTVLPNEARSLPLLCAETQARLFRRKKNRRTLELNLQLDDLHQRQILVYQMLFMADFHFWLPLPFGGSVTRAF